MIDTCITKNLPQANSDGCVTTGNYIPRPGTLMSYCHLTNPTRSVGLYFHDRVKPIIRGFAETASCLRKATDPTLILLNPIGGTTFFPGDKIAIRWAFSNVETVAVKYSLDNGKSWHWIETYADAKAGFIMWTVPDSLTNQVLFHISDSYNAYIYDQLTTPCSIDKPHFAMKNPGDGARLGQNEKYKITWDQKFINSIKIEFTSESDLMLIGGQPNWTVISENIDGFETTWEVPEILSENCMLRLTGKTENGGEFMIYSGKFAIGKAFCEILAPKPGEKVCANTKYDVQWQSDFVTNLYIQYSTDGGSKWRHIFLNGITGSLGKYSWSVPSNYSDNCLFRISQFENKNLVLAEQNLPFSIDSCETSLTEFLSDKSEELSFIDITPNPATAITKLKFEYKSAIFKPIDILVLNSKGEQFLLQTFTPEKFGENVMDLELGNLAQGNYFILLQSGNSMVSKNLIIIK
jgi:hypothetical protein